MLIAAIILLSLVMAISRYVFIVRHRLTMKYMLPSEKNLKNKFKPVEIPFPEFDLELDSARMAQFFHGWLHYMLTMSEVVPVLLPALLWLQDWYLR